MLVKLTYPSLHQAAKIPLTPLQVDELISVLDQDGDGEIDFGYVSPTYLHHRI